MKTVCFSLGPLVALTVLFSCSSSDKPPAAGGIDNGNDASITEAGTLEEAGGDAGKGDPLGDLDTVDEPGGPCVPAGGTRTVLFGAGPVGGTGGPAIRNVGALGSARFGAGPNYPGFVTFDATGGNPQSFPLMLGTEQTVFVAEGDTIGGFGANVSTVDYQRYDGAGATVGSKVTLASGLDPKPNAIWAAGNGSGGSLVVWTAGSALSAAGVTAGGAAAGSAFPLGASGTSVDLAVTFARGKYAIAYSLTRASDGMAAAAIQFADATGLSGAAVPITSGAGTVEVVAIAPTPNGFLLLFEGGGDDHGYVVPLDTAGKVSGAARRLLDGDEPWALAPQGNEVGLVMMSNDTKVNNQEGPRKPQFRPLDQNGKALGPWVCLDGPIDANKYQDMGVLGTGTGYSVVFKSAADETVLQRFDHLGTGAP